MKQAGFLTLFYLLATVSLISAGDVRAQLLFYAREDYDNPFDSWDVAAEDFNEDGYQDLVVANRGSQDVSILIGRGEGSFQDAIIYDVGGSPVAVATGDFDEDGRQDIATAISRNVSILLGNGDGTFQGYVHYRVSEYYYCQLSDLAIEDFNNDGHLDLAVANEDSDYVSILLGRGDGSFQEARDYGVGIGPKDVATGDFNEDGHLDLAVANNFSLDVSILMGCGDGSFQAAVYYDIKHTVQAVATGDFDEDGHIDLAVVWHGTLIRGCIFFGRGDGSFRAALEYIICVAPRWDEIAAVVPVDFDGNGHLDLIVAGTPCVSILFGNGDGTFQDAFIPGFFLANGLATEDFNEDGHQDLAVANYYYVSILLGNGDGSVQITSHYEAGPGPVSVAAGDLDEDGHLDLAVACDLGYLISGSILLGHGDGSFQEPRFLSTGNSQPNDVALGDFDEDGHLDLVVVNTKLDNVSVLLGKGDGSFQTAIHFESGDSPRSADTGDFDEDGRLDLAVANYSSDNVSILLGNGDGTFQETVHYDSGETPIDVAIEDFDEDGRLDLAVANEFDNNVSIFLGNGDGSFQEPLYFAAGERPNAVAVGDFDEDGRLDLAFPRWFGELSILLGNGDGTFQDYVQYIIQYISTYVIDHAIRDVTVWDFDEDGHLDLALAVWSNIPVLLGNGDGTFQDALKYDSGGGHSVAPGDFDEDGHQDIAVATIMAVSILLNRLDHDEDGHVAILHGGEDCDDDEPLAYPGMKEIQGDGIDNDCDGYVDESCFIGSVIGCPGKKLLFCQSAANLERTVKPIH